MSTPFNVLFICTHNSARSIMAEAILNHTSNGRFQAWSAGSQPSGQVQAMALDLLERNRMDTSKLHSKSWETFSRADAPVMDFVLTVCDKAAGEVCPVWPGQPLTAHWGVEDPSAAKGTPEEQARAYSSAFMMLNRRIGIFQNLPIEKLDKLSLHSELRRIGEIRDLT